MIRPVELTAVILASALLASSGQAANLYRWAERDGSLTYSPTPPPAGVDYQIVDSRTLKPAGENSASAAATAATGSVAGSVAGTAARQSIDTAATTPAGNAPSPLRYAPSVAAPAAAPRNNAAMDAISSAAASTATGTNASDAAVRASNKPSQCQDLRKRVVSLERRLRSPLSPTDMDNTVLQMARYQKSVDQFCLD